MSNQQWVYNSEDFVQLTDLEEQLKDEVSNEKAWLAQYFIYEYCQIQYTFLVVEIIHKKSIMNLILDLSVYTILCHLQIVRLSAF